MEPKIIFEDEWILVLDKPAGWVVNDAETVKDTPTVQAWIAKNFDFETTKERRHRAGIVHRLDKETSGILLIAKTTSVFEKLQAQFKNREVKKMYMALVHGKVDPREGEIKATVGRLPWRRDRFGVLPGGREAETVYKVDSYYTAPATLNSLPTTHYSQLTTHHTLLTLYPKTGRTHQIRIHLKYIGHPIVSDEFYAGRKTARKDRKWCPRLFLHASEISFNHPKTGEELSFRSEIPKDLKEALNNLKVSI